MSTRADWVDYAKSIGIILVVYGHIARGLFHAGIEMPASLYKLADSVVYSFHMPLFFFLSGLFFYHSFINRGAIGLTLNKVDTIVYPYIVWSILQGSVAALLSNYTNESITLTEVFTLWVPIAQFWFLYALFFIFVSSCAIFYFVSEKYVAWIFILACIIYTNYSIIPDIKPLKLVANNLVYFILGIIFTKYDFSKKFSSTSSLVITWLVFILSQYLFHGYWGMLYTDKGVETLFLAFVSILFIVSLSITIAKVPCRFLAYIGASSMAIYVMHILAGSGARVLLIQVFAIDAIAIHLVVGCLAGVLLPLLVLTMMNALKISMAFSSPISK